MKRKSVEVTASEPRFRLLVPAVRAYATCVLRALGKQAWGMEVCLVGDSVMRTNVLSYSAPADAPRPDWGGRFLGELYLNPHEARERGEKLQVLIIHGILHLVGYDHERKQDILKMRTEEKQLLVICKSILLD